MGIENEELIKRIHAIPISSISQVGLLMSTFRIPRHCETRVGLLLELKLPPNNRITDVYFLGSLSTQ